MPDSNIEIEIGVEFDVENRSEAPPKGVVSSAKGVPVREK